MTIELGRRRWGGDRALRIAFLAGKGRSNRDIARDLGDGTSPDAVRMAVGRLAFGDRREIAGVPVALSARHREKLAVRARRLGVDPEEFLRRVCVCVLDDDLYGAVVDGRFA